MARPNLSSCGRRSTTTGDHLLLRSSLFLLGADRAEQTLVQYTIYGRISGVGFCGSWDFSGVGFVVALRPIILYQIEHTEYSTQHKTGLKMDVE